MIKSARVFQGSIANNRQGNETNLTQHKTNRSRESPGAKSIAVKTDANGAEALIIATEWKEFTTVDLKELQKVMHTPLIFDGRNIMDPKTVRAAGFQYTSIGRS